MSRMPAAQVHDQGLMLGANARPDPGVRCRAVRMVATLSADAGECKRVLDQLGLEPAEGLKGQQG